MRLKFLCLVPCLVFALTSSAFAEWHHTRSGKYIYKVDDPGTTLSLISLELYGNAHHWRQIAKWNHIPAPYMIRIRQKLVIEKAPTLSKAQGSDVVLAYWRKRMGLTGAPEIAETPTETAAQTSTYSAVENPSENPAEALPPLPSEIPVANNPPSVDQQKLLTAQKQFHKRHLVSAFKRVESVVASYQQNDRAPASVSQNELLDQMHLVWYDGPTADVAYRAMSAVPESKINYEKQECTQKRGESLICIRCPASVPSDQNKTRCAGTFN